MWLEFVDRRVQIVGVVSRAGVVDRGLCEVGMLCRVRDLACQGNFLSTMGMKLIQS